MSATSYDHPPLPLLVTGVAGVAGYNAFHFFRQRYPGQVFGTRRADNWPLRGPGIEPCDIYDRDGLKRLFDRHQFASVLHTEGTCKLKSCELDPSLAWQVNVEGIENLLNQLSPTTRLVHLSIDMVFSGTASGNHLETDPTDPVNVYGKSMELAEQIITSRRPDAALLRISLPMGVSFNGHAGAIDWIQSRFKKQKPATLYYDEVRSPTYTDCLNRVCLAMLANKASGIFHAGGPRKLCLFQIGQIINRIGGYDPNHLQGCFRQEAGPIPPRAGDVSMNSQKLAATLGFAPFDPWPLLDEHFPTHPEWHFERPTGERGSAELLAQVLYNNPRYSSPDDCVLPIAKSNSAIAGTSSANVAKP